MTSAPSALPSSFSVQSPTFMQNGTRQPYECDNKGSVDQNNRVLNVAAHALTGKTIADKYDLPRKVEAPDELERQRNRNIVMVNIDWNKGSISKYWLGLKNRIS